MRAGNLAVMRTLLAPDDMVDDMLAERRVRGWDLYDYEIDGVYHMAPAPSIDHADIQLRVGAVMLDLARDKGLKAIGPANLGKLKGDVIAYLIPDITIVEPGASGSALLHASVAVEILSPNEDEDAKVADYARVVELTGLQLDELWYVDATNAQVRIRDARLQLVDHSTVFGRTAAEFAELFGLRPSI